MVFYAAWSRHRNRSTDPYPPRATQAQDTSASDLHALQGCRFDANKPHLFLNFAYGLFSLVGRSCDDTLGCLAVDVRLDAVGVAVGFETLGGSVVAGFVLKADSKTCRSCSVSLVKSMGPSSAVCTVGGRLVRGFGTERAVGGTDLSGAARVADSARPIEPPICE